MLVISAQGSFDEAKKSIQEGQRYGELIELRLDLLEKNDLGHISKLKNLSKLPLIFTLRRKDQGGAFSGSESEREEKLLELLTLKPEYVDLEYDCVFADKIPGISIISSYHDFEKTPDNLEEVLAQMERFPAVIKKISTMANSSIDSLRMLNFSKSMELQECAWGKRGKLLEFWVPLLILHWFMHRLEKP